MDWFLFVVEMLVIGVVVGLISNVLGLGGGVVMVPAFVTFVDAMDINTAKGTSLLIIAFVAGVNAWRMGVGAVRPPAKLVSSLVITSMIGGFAAGYATGLMPEDIVTWILIFFILLVAVRTFFLQPPVVTDDDVVHRPGVALGIGLFSGVVGGGTGTGGGAILVPLALMAGLTTNSRVVLLSNTVMAATAAASAVAHMLATQTTPYTDYVLGQVYFPLVPVVFAGAMAIGPAGRRINARLSLGWRKALLGGLLLIIVARLMYRMMAA